MLLASSSENPACAKVVSQDSSQRRCKRKLVNHAAIVGMGFGREPRGGCQSATQNFDPHCDPIKASLVLRLRKEIELTVLFVVIGLLIIHTVPVCGAR